MRKPWYTTCFWLDYKLWPQKRFWYSRFVTKKFILLTICGISMIFDKDTKDGNH